MFSLATEMWTSLSPRQVPPFPWTSPILPMNRGCPPQEQELSFPEWSVPSLPWTCELKEAFALNLPSRILSQRRENYQSPVVLTLVLACIDYKILSHVLWWDIYKYLFQSFCLPHLYWLITLLSRSFLIWYDLICLFLLLLPMIWGNTISII